MRLGQFHSLVQRKTAYRHQVGLGRLLKETERSDCKKCRWLSLGENIGARREQGIPTGETGRPIMQPIALQENRLIMGEECLNWLHIISHALIHQTLHE